jgi:hypothetical protein
MNQALTQTITLGAMTGVRTMSGPVCAAQLHPKSGLHRARIVVDVLAVMESLADKFLPLPPRSSAVPLIGRAATGALLGYFVAKSNRAAFALLGAASAAAAAILAVRVRRTITTQLRVPDVVVGFAEDAALAGAGLALAKTTGHRVRLKR